MKGASYQQAGGKRANARTKFGQGWRNTQMTTSWKIEQAMDRPMCCGDCCTMQFKKVDYQHVRGQYWVHNRDKKDEYLKAIFRQRMMHAAYSKLKYTIVGRKVCSTALRNIIGVSKKLTQRWVRVVVHEDYISALRSNSWIGREHTGTKLSNVVGWLSVYTGLRGTWGDWQPHTQELHLAFVHRRQIYHAYKADMILQYQDSCSEQYFGKQFELKFPHVKIHAWKNFSQCTRCFELYGALEGNQDRVWLKEKRLLLEDHLVNVLTEKRKYWRHIQKARQDPTSYMCTILDGMDSNKSVLPHFPRVPKAFTQTWNMGFHVEGVLNHGHEPHAAAYLSGPNVGKGGCLSIETLMRLLVRQKQDHGYVPATWYIQADNAPSEFKNSVCLLFLGMLVQIGIFEKVRSFKLPQHKTTYSLTLHISPCIAGESRL